VIRVERKGRRLMPVDLEQLLQKIKDGSYDNRGWNGASGAIGGTDMVITGLYLAELISAEQFARIYGPFALGLLGVIEADLKNGVSRILYPELVSAVGGGEELITRLQDVLVEMKEEVCSSHGSS